jgi:hypothetical protein
MTEEIVTIKNTLKAALPLGTISPLTYMNMAMNSTRPVHQTRNAIRYFDMGPPHAGKAIAHKGETLMRPIIELSDLLRTHSHRQCKLSAFLDVPLYLPK